MARPLVSDELWELIEPLIPVVPRRHRFPGRKRIDDRKVLTGILFVLQTGIPWEYLPQEMGCGSGMTCWRRLREWQQAGVWQRLHELLLAKLNEAERIDWSRADVLEVAAVENQQPVQALRADSADEPFGDRVCLWRAHRCLDGPDAFAAEDLVEGAAVLAVAVADQEAHAALAQVEAEVARLLGHPRTSRIPRAAREPDATARVR